MGAYKVTDYLIPFYFLILVPASISCTKRDDYTELETKTGEFASYNYPLPYDDDVKCIWRIIVDSDYQIKLSFDYFNLSLSSDCSDDYVEVRDWQFYRSELLGKFCGADIPESITSDSRGMSVTFKSSGKTKYPGFKASYKTKSKFVMVKVTFGFLASSFLFNSNLPDGGAH